MIPFAKWNLFLSAAAYGEKGILTFEKNTIDDGMDIALPSQVLFLS